MPVLAVALALGCGDGDGEGDPGDSGAADLDSGPRERTREELPAPGPLLAGIAQVALPSPVGIGTMGYGAFGLDPSVTPFADNFPGTTRMHGALDLRAVALSRGPAHELVLVRMDTVGVFQQLREAVLREIEERTGRDLDDALVLAGNHTHSGPGRLLMTDGALVALGDSFFPEFYDRVVDAIATVVTEALADLSPAELGWTIGASSEGHSDRRCENDALPQVQEISDMPLVAVRRGGRVDAVVASYAYHGTVLGIGDLTLSGDVGSTVEQRIEERFEHPVTVLFFNSWGADMAPGDPAADPAAVGADQPSGYDRMDRLGEVIADAVLPAVAGLTFTDDLAVRARTYRVRLDREVIGYEVGSFNYPYGGAFCGLGSEGNCVDAEPVAGLDTRCARISSSENLPRQTMITAGRIGDLYLVTGSGEWSTALSDGVLAQVREQTGGDAMFIGYANDFTGYSLGEDDWWQGGYESSGALWGPRQGDYLAARTVEAFETFFDGWVEPPFEEPEAVAPFSGYTYDPYVPEAGVEVGTIAQDVPPTATATDVISFTVHGRDPWLGTPVATLEHDGGSGFAPVLRRNGRGVDSDSYDFWVDLATDPTYADALRSEARTFLWTFHFPVARRAGSTLPPLAGPHRFRVRIPAAPGGEEVTVETGTFVVDTPDP